MGTLSAPRGGRSTDAADYPTELTAYTLRALEGIKRSAAEQGPAVAEFADRLFDGPLPWAKVRQGHKLVRLGQRYTPGRHPETPGGRRADAGKKPQYAPGETPGEMASVEGRRNAGKKGPEGVISHRAF